MRAAGSSNALASLCDGRHCDMHRVATTCAREVNEIARERFSLRAHHETIE